jgi:hypothetical protein
VADADESGQVPSWVKEVVSDFQRPTPISVDIGFVPAGHGAQFWISEHGETDGAGCAIARDDSAEARVELADWLQDQFFAETRGAWAEARPACPSHSHPAVAEERNGEAWWVCPADGHAVAPIGRVIGSPSENGER